MRRNTFLGVFLVAIGIMGLYYVYAQGRSGFGIVEALEIDEDYTQSMGYPDLHVARARETRFAFSLLALGLLAGVILGSLGASLLGDRVERMSLGSVWILIAIGIVVNIVETFVIVRRMIP